MNGHRIKVLLVDDQALIGAAVRRMLAGEPDIDFHFVADASQALETADRIGPTVILQDLVMPEVDGLTLVGQYRERPTTRETPIIVLSGAEEPRTKAEAFATGASDYIVKLPDPIELVARIRHHSRGYINMLERNEAYRALQAREKSLAQDVAQAAKYVRSLLPAPLKKGPIRADWRFIPSATLGGDTFGYHWLDDEHFALFLLDVSGHGVGPALLSVSALNTIRSRSLPETDFRKPEQVVAALNRAFQMEQQNNLYFTLWYGVLHAPSGRLEFAGGGHPPVLLLTDRGVEELATAGPMVGAFDDAMFPARSTTIAGPARLFLYSDGCHEIELADASMWPFADFAAFLGTPATSGNSRMDELIDHARGLQGREAFVDDVSIVEFTFNAAAN